MVVNERLTVKFDIWDTAGQEKYRSVVSMYYRGAVGALVVYDITSLQSFNNIHEWIKGIRDVEPDCELMIVGNKEDLDDLRQVDFEALQIVAEKYKCEYMEVSAKSNKHVKEVFDAMARKIYLREKEKNHEDETKLSYIHVEEKDQKKKKCC